MPASGPNLVKPGVAEHKPFRSKLISWLRGGRTAQLIAFPESRRKLIKELRQASLLGKTSDGKLIYLVQYNLSPTIIRELGRLREVSFRAVGEGTLRARDLDQYDAYYEHIVLWDAQAQEIIGGYRIANAGQVLRQHPGKPLYTESLFRLSQPLRTDIAQGIELGRSFIQPKYWGKRNLDYLWTGIGAYLSQHPEIRYIFGAVSVSNRYSLNAQSVLVHFYQTWFPAKRWTVETSKPLCTNIPSPFAGTDYREDFRLMKQLLKQQGQSVPTLYKHYAEFCKTGGVEFLGFNIDPDFNNCLDAFVIADLQRVKNKKYKRYIACHESPPTELFPSEPSSKRYGQS